MEVVSVTNTIALTFAILLSASSLTQGAPGDSYLCKTVDEAAAYDHKYVAAGEVASIKGSTFALVEGRDFIVVVRTLANGSKHGEKFAATLDTAVRLVASTGDTLSTRTLVMSRSVKDDRDIPATITDQAATMAMTWLLACDRRN